MHLPVPPTVGRRGFSLIELLVVVSIIVVLAGMLLPVIGLVRDSARSLQCMSNLRQFQMANAYYRQDAKQWVAAFTVIPPPTGQWGNRWQDNPAYIDYLTDGKVTDGKFSKIPKSLLCPLAKPDYTDWWFNPMVSIYGNNYHHDGAWEKFNCYKGTKALVAFVDALDMLVAFDRHLHTLNNAYVVTPQGLPEGLLVYNAVAFRHRFRANVAFFDGHVESMSYQQLNVESLWWDPGAL